MSITAKGFTGSVGQSDMSKLLAAGAGWGILGTYFNNYFNTTRVAGSRTVNVLAGDLWGPGVVINSSTTAQPAASSANITGSPRIDMLVMRLDWTTNPGTATLMIVEGGGAPPSLWGIPGTKFDIPLYRLTLQSGASDYATADIADCRVWLVDGQMVQPSGAIDPARVAGRMLIQPDTGLVQIGASDAGFWQYKPWSDTDTIPLGVTLPAGFSGGCTGRKLNGVAQISIQWRRTAGSASNLMVDSGLPPGWRPADIDHTVTGWQDNIPIRVFAFRDGNLTMGPINTYAGAVIRAILRFNHA